MPIAAVAAVVGAAAAVAGTVGTLKNQKKANKMQKQQYQFERQLANNRAGRERRDAVRAGRLATATVRQAAANSGGADMSSVALGAMGSIQSQINSNLSFLDTGQKLADRAGLAGSRANQAINRAQMWQGVTDLGKTIFSAAGGTGAITGGG